MPRTRQYNNTFNGLSGTNSPTNVLSQEMGDGLVQATVDGLTCYGNTVTNHGAEGIFIQNLLGTPVHPCSIYNNNVAQAISLAGGWGIRCDLSGSQIYGNTIENAASGFATVSATNLSFYNNTVAVASASFAWAFGICASAGVDCFFSNNTVTLNLSNAVTNAILTNYPFGYNVGIAAQNGSNNCFSGNTVTVSPAQYTTNGSGYYGIAVDAMFLDANFDNFTDNFFTNGGLGVLAEGYPISPTDPYPNSTSNSVITNGIFLRNAFH